jgi:hypothetical protein
MDSERFGLYNVLDCKKDALLDPWFLRRSWGSVKKNKASLSCMAKCLDMFRMGTSWSRFAFLARKPVSNPNETRAVNI